MWFRMNYICGLNIVWKADVSKLFSSGLHSKVKFQNTFVSRRRQLATNLAKFPILNPHTTSTHSVKPFSLFLISRKKILKNRNKENVSPLMQYKHTHPIFFYRISPYFLKDLLPITKVCSVNINQNTLLYLL